jgi:CrcB protein
VIAWVGVGVLGAAGAYMRFSVAAAVTARRPSAFPFGTFVVNMSGGFALGLLTGLGVADDVRLVLGTGLLGAYTTFSTWMVESQRLGEDAAWSTMCLYLAGSMLAGVAITGVGWLVGGAIA